MTSVSKRQAFFSQFSRKVHECLPKGPDTPLVVLTGGFRTYATINSALTNGHTELVGIGRLSIHDPHLPARLESKKRNYVPPPLPDFTISAWDLLFNWLGWLTGVKVPLLMGAGREMCWYTVQLGKVASFAPIDYGVSGFGAMVRSVLGVKVRPRDDCATFPQILSILFAVLFSVGFIKIWNGVV